MLSLLDVSTAIYRYRFGSNAKPLGRPKKTPVGWTGVFFCAHTGGLEKSYFTNFPAATRTASLQDKKACGVFATSRAVMPCLIARASSWMISAA